MVINLNQNATMILTALTWQIRVSTDTQLQRILDARCPRAPRVRSIVRRLAHADLVGRSHTSVAYVDIRAPLLSWAPGEVTPDLQSIAWRLEQRWRVVRPRRTTVCWATRKAARLLGGMAPFAQHASQMEHDLGTAGILVAFHETRPRLVSSWISEDILRRDYRNLPACRRKVPDAALVDDARVLKVIEFGGQYSVQRLRRFHEHCRRYRLTYELW